MDFKISLRHQFETNFWSFLLLHIFFLFFLCVHSFLFILCYWLLYQRLSQPTDDPGCLFMFKMEAIKWWLEILCALAKIVERKTLLEVTELRVSISIDSVLLQSKSKFSTREEREKLPVYLELERVSGRLTAPFALFKPSSILSTEFYPRFPLVCWNFGLFLIGSSFCRLIFLYFFYCTKSVIFFFYFKISLRALICIVPDVNSLSLWIDTFFCSIIAILVENWGKWC